MNEVTPEQWIEALESGEWKKARGVLYNENTGGHCCIGVLHRLCGTSEGEILDHNKSFYKEKLPMWAATVSLNPLAAENDRVGGWPIQKIREIFIDRKKESTQ